MKVGFYIKFLQERPHHETAEILRRKANTESIKLLKKGLRPMRWTAVVGHDSDDFIKNYYTVVCTAQAIKIPRFVRNYLLKKKYEVRRIKH